MLKYNRDSKGERHVIVNGVLMVKQGKRGRP
ncbi:phage NinH family protein [Escherichia coli O10]|nr:phage NinH family protein [Escherichia coli]